MSSRITGILRRVAVAGALSGVVAGAAEAQTFTLDFNGLGLTSGQAIPQTYGDVPGVVDVTIRGRNGFGNSALVPTAANGLFWTTGYNDLVNVAYVGSSARVGEVVLDNLAAGQQITINAADVGSWPNATTTVALRVYDFNWNQLFAGTGATVGSTIHASFAPGVADLDGLYVQWARLNVAGDPIEAFNTAIDNINFTVGPVAPTAAPEPATLGLLAAGVGFLGLGATRRRRVS